MAFETLYIFREIAILADITGVVTLQIWAETLENGVSISYSVNLPAAAFTTPHRLRLPGNLKGHTPRLRLSGSGTARVYGCQILAKPVGTLGGEGAAWSWYTVAIEATPELFSRAALPIPVTPEGWSTMDWPIPGTPESWSAAALPIPQTAEGWSPVPLPLRQSASLFEWWDVPMDGIE